MVLDLDLVLLLLLVGKSSKKEMSCMTCPPGESIECLGVNSGEEVGVRVDFSMFQPGRNDFLNVSCYW